MVSWTQLLRTWGSWSRCERSRKWSQRDFRPTAMDFSKQVITVHRNLIQLYGIVFSSTCPLSSALESPIHLHLPACIPEDALCHAPPPSPRLSHLDPISLTCQPTAPNSSLPCLPPLTPHILTQMATKPSPSPTLGPP